VSHTVADREKDRHTDGQTGQCTAGSSSHRRRRSWSYDSVLLRSKVREVIKVRSEGSHVLSH